MKHLVILVLMFAGVNNCYWLTNFNVTNLNGNKLINGERAPRTRRRSVYAAARPCRALRALSLSFLARTLDPRRPGETLPRCDVAGMANEYDYLFKASAPCSARSAALAPHRL